ncbi:MAG TPA: hypothetical protein VFM54_21100 [Micromonosporaceae bacterium]|nr:hypothetical protein [Micromonosporaceae bacterium]
MIVRILGEGQYDLPDTELPRLNMLDTRLQAAADAGDEAVFGDLLSELLAAVRAGGSRVPDAVLTPSELVLPGPDSRLAEVVALIGDEGLIPG